MNPRRAVWLAGFALVALLGLRAPARPAVAEEAGTPFPVGRSVTVRDEGQAYVIDGAQVIPRGVEITVQADVRIVGINGASLDVQGGLKVHGTQDHWVRIENVDFSPTVAPNKGLHLDMADLHGCRFQHAQGQALDGFVTIENSCLQRDCVFAVRMWRGFLKIMTVEFGMLCTIACVKGEKSAAPIEIEVRSSWMKAIAFSGEATATFRHSEIQDGLVGRDFSRIVVDGCDIGQELAFHQGPGGSFKKLELTKCNLIGGARLLLAREGGPQTKKEKVRVQRFYFGPKTGGGVKTEKEAQALIIDGADVEEGNVFAQPTKPNKRPHVLVNYDTLRMRAPPLR
jgi:hypothetical protein